MSNELLDLILERLALKHHGIMLYIHAFLDENQDIKNNPEKWDAIKYLECEQYISIHGLIHSDGQVKITPKGKLKIRNGGFCSEAKYMEETLKVAKESRDYAKKAVLWSVILGVAGIITTIVISLL